ncbi:hypothetical protein VXL39_02205 [Phaeobacter sp. JH20_25]|uniref:hypothetical protein n=1 Tax=Phaeobacter sp. JH20_25 TaxID=3112482 RepID=UPI003A880B48
MTNLIKAADALAEQMRLIEEEAKRTIEWDEEDPIRMLDWFDTEWINSLTAYRQARESADGVKVKPLVWIEVPAYSTWYYAKTEVGEYRCGWDHSRGFYFTMVGNDVVGLKFMKGLTEAKAAAQSDYEARIKAALEG